MAILLALAGLLFFSLGFSLYGRFIEGLFVEDFSSPTPANELKDGVDFYPAKWFVLFGHHFSSIAGAAPIIGPVLAISMWGWVAPYWWVVLGSVFLGGFHDFGALVVSMRSKARSIGAISEEVISKRAKLVFSVFLLLALILIVAVFAFFAAKTFIVSKEAVVPSLGLIPVAVLTGVLMYVRKWLLLPVTFIGVALLSFLLLVGKAFPVSISGEHAMAAWIVLLLLYALFASITPVQYLLQPRDYLSSYLLFFGLIVGYIGIFASHPVIRLESFVSSGKGPSNSSLFPFLFVTIACGAISGFHSLVSSGTTAKQISHYKDARKVAYGGMLAEGALALLTVLAISSAYADVSSLAQAIKTQGPINAFADAYLFITRPVLGQWGKAFAVIMLNAFILTTLDTATRLGRYIAQELLPIRDRFLSALVIILPAMFLAITGSYQALWPVFGSANQLIAAIVLLVLASFLSKNGKNSSIAMAFSGFMFLVTISALYIGAVKYVSTGSWILFFLSLSLMALSIVLIFEYVRNVIWKK